MPEPTTAQPVEAPDPFQGGEPSFEEFSKWRESGAVPERFKASTEGEKKEIEAPAAQAETEDGKEPPKETEQEKEARERDEKGQFKAKEKDDPLFTPEQQKAFDKAFAKREAKLRREFETRYAPQTSSTTQVTAPAKQPETGVTAEPQRPEPPKLSTYKGTVEEYEKELGEYPAKLQAFYDAKRNADDHMAARSKRILDSESKAVKEHPDYVEEFRKLTADILNNEEPKLPLHVLHAIQEETDDPHGITYHLATNREEFRRLAELGPREALREVLKLDVKLALAKDVVSPAPAKDLPKPKPKPPDPVGARAAVSAFDVNDEKIDADEWARQRNDQLAKRRR